MDAHLSSTTDEHEEGSTMGQTTKLKRRKLTGKDFKRLNAGLVQARELVARLAQVFPVLTIGDAPEDVAAILGGIDYGESNELGALCQLELLKSDGRLVSNAALLVFLENYGQSWTLARLEAVKAQLRKQLAAAGKAVAA